MSAAASYDGLEPIAVVGMAGRFPKAPDLDTYWRNLCEGVEGASFFSEDELLAAGVPREELEDPAYVRASAVVEGADLFDASFFGYSPRDAEILDPQHRLFLECAWEALESAAYDPGRFADACGVFAGCFMNKYLTENLLRNESFRRWARHLDLRVYSDKDFLATRIAYKLDLRGPSFTVQSACSTSLVAVHLACQSLLSFECDMALAGGVALSSPLKSGYFAVDGLFSRDGRCRAFDARSGGTFPGYGAGAVVLRRLEDALADGAPIRALIRATAINNDGSQKAGFTAPSVDAQSEVVAACHSLAGVDPASIGLIEAHGTGTNVGDPIEVAALTQAFRLGTDRRGFCALGSVKSNIGHLDSAAGVAGLIKAVLALENRRIPASLHFAEPNPKLALETSPFYVPTSLTEWSGDGPRRAGVTSLGIGGTNAHVLLEEAPAAAGETPRPAFGLLPLSARSPEALGRTAERLAGHLESREDLALADVAHTLQVGRAVFAERRTLVCRTRGEAVELLRRLPRPEISCRYRGGAPDVLFLFGGVGSQYPGMMRGLYEGEAIFREHLDRCAEILRGHLGRDLREVLYPDSEGGSEAAELLAGPRFMLPALFASQVSLARLWRGWGVEPRAMLGHSFGEYAAACLAGVLDLEDALRLVVVRGELTESLAEGGMLSAELSAEALRELLSPGLCLAADNAAALSVASGPRAEIEALAQRLAGLGIRHRRLATRRAFHSQMVEPILGEFEAFVSTLALKPPQIPYVSSLTGDWATDEVTRPEYWARHLRRTVRFRQALATLLTGSEQVLLDLGPGRALTSLVRQQGLEAPPHVTTCVRAARQEAPDVAVALGALGELWEAGVAVDWPASGDAGRRRIALPTYPFERRRFWIDADGVASAEGSREASTSASASTLASVGGGRYQLAEPGDGFIAPRDRREEQIAELWGELLGIDRVGVEDDFFQLGGHSLMGVDLISRINALFSASLDVDILYRFPTVAEVARRVADAPQPGTVTGEAVDLESEPFLDPEIRPSDHSDPHGFSAPTTGESGAVLLTGATGFLGAFLLAELLHSTSSRVYCLVRAADVADGAARLRANLDSYRLFSGHLEEPASRRIVPVLGDLSRPRLGLSPESFQRLARQVGAIYHCGAWVNFAMPYRSLKATNVGGTQEVLRLATQGDPKPLHFVSTYAVTSGTILDNPDLGILESDSHPGRGHDSGYAQSKWVAERLVKMAQDRGVPCAVYRPAMVLGDQRTGVLNRSDYITKILQACSLLKLAPRRSYPLYMAPVDFVAAAIVHLARRRASLGQCFHVFSPQPLPWNRMFDFARAYGHEVETVAYEEWAQALAERAEETGGEGGGDEALQQLAALGTTVSDRRMPPFDCRNLERGLAGSGIPIPALDEALFAKYLGFLAEVGMTPEVEPVT